MGNVLTANLSADLTSPEAAQANVKAAALVQCDFTNSQRKESYLSYFSDWVKQQQSGQPYGPPPQPPTGVVPTEFAPGWWWVGEGTEPVCEMPPIPDPPKSNLDPKPPMNIHILKPVGNSDHWFIAALDDTFPVGKTTPPLDLPGVAGQHVCLRVGTAVGNGWYERMD